jgi:hypothetical protein
MVNVFFKKEKLVEFTSKLFAPKFSPFICRKIAKFRQKQNQWNYNCKFNISVSNNYIILLSRFHAENRIFQNIIKKVFNFLNKILFSEKESVLKSFNNL